MELHFANCAVCVLRPRDLRGRGTCPHAGTPTYEKLAKLDAHECGAFRPGDAKAWIKREKAENLAANLELF